MIFINSNLRLNITDIAGINFVDCLIWSGFLIDIEAKETTLNISLLSSV